MNTSAKSLIIGGTSKAGTTSLFNYLAAHPNVNAAIGKETRFFLDENYPLSSVKRIHQSDPLDYEHFFLKTEKSNDEKYRLEATPDYLYSCNTAESIHKTLPDSRFIFILREPISRLKSWYNFGISMNEIPKEMSFNRWIETQKQHKNFYPDEIQHPAFAALQHGRYSYYLKPYIDLFGRNSIYICFIEELKQNTEDFMRKLLVWLDLPIIYQNESFSKVVNKGVAAKNPAVHQAYVQFSEQIRGYFRRVPRIKKLLSPFSHLFKYIYNQLNTRNISSVNIDENTLNFLRNYYSEEAENLKRLFEVSPPWK